jgi:DNA-binding NtrC family response regulator
MIVEQFERGYITEALERHGGNIAMAARASNKHRRAFWALMRKHKIDAALYRQDEDAE